MRNFTNRAMAVLTLAVWFAAAGSGEGPAMACNKLEQKQVGEERARLEAKPLYAPAGSGRSTVEFSFNLKPPETGDSLFVILSGRLQKAVYRGPYQTTINVEFDSVLAGDGHYDGLEFWLLLPKEQKLCIWVNERGEPYWRPGAHIAIGLLEKQTVDADGLPKRFDVTIR
jgi:hypothetical protein